ncbi:hypothetical protein L1987_28245 [Smallanthus sonchifolius]|uniref:Uncharacterized protein n=1 Tax=Smallanthus sonchifolius TaxID=185202 RepID=A0ACB9IE45_9ASTR|nr:hypothetical protein L1987_28245 [Smallanthus sonchifolius]
MDKLPHAVLLQILSRLDDSADVARCRFASKAFDTVFPSLRSINLQCSLDWYNSSRSRVSNSQQIKPFKTVFLHLISKLETVKSVCISLHWRVVRVSDGFYLTDGDFAKEWLPRVSGSLKSLSISDLGDQRCPQNVLPLISEYCHNLVSLKLKYAWLSVHNMNPMPMLTSLTLENIRLEDANLNKLNKCFPNLQVLNLEGVKGLKDPKIHLLNLKTCLWDVDDSLRSLTLITPNLITLEFESSKPVALHVEAPMLSHFNLDLSTFQHAAFTIKKFENLKTLWVYSSYTGSLLSKFPIIKTVENLTLDSGNEALRDARDSKLTLRKVFTVSPNISSLYINSGAWSELEACLNPKGWEILDGREGLKTIWAYLELDDPPLTFSSVARVLDQCVGLSEVSLLIHTDVDNTVSKGFMSKCVARWPELKWRWGIWSHEMKDSWINDVSISTVPTSHITGPMDKLPHSLLLQILSRLDDSADVARCRVASKAFGTVFPGLRSINLRCSLKWYDSSRSRVSSSQRVKHFKTVFLDLISKLETVESVCIVFWSQIYRESDDIYLTDGDFAELLPRVSGSLKSLSISGHHSESPSHVLPLISEYCPNLVLLVVVTGHEDPKIHLLNLKTCYWYVYDKLPSLTLITPNLISLKIEGIMTTALYIEAPMLSHFHLGLNSREHPRIFTVKKFENLKTVWLDSSYTGSFLSEFPITKTVKTLTLDSGDEVPKEFLTLEKVFTVFPNVSSLCIKSGPWSELESCLNLEGWEILDGRKGLKTLCAYLMLVDPSLTFSYVACVLDQCVSL